MWSLCRAGTAEPQVDTGYWLVPRNGAAAQEGLSVIRPGPSCWPFCVRELASRVGLRQRRVGVLLSMITAAPSGRACGEAMPGMTTVEMPAACDAEERCHG